MNNEQYWQKRAKEREEKWLNKSKSEIETEIKNLYIRALRNIEKDINDLYERFSDENGLSLADAKKLITSNEYSVWRMDIEDYVKQANIDKEILKELNTLAMRSRISRLDKLQAEILVELSKMADGYDSKLTEYLKKALTDNYYQSVFDICKGINILMPVSILDQEAIEDIIRTSWSGKQFSKRIWNNTTKLSKVLKKEISDAIIRGINAREMATVISKKMNSGYKQAITLVRSELNYVNNQAGLKSIKDSGGQEYRFIATLDRRTSEKCRKLDNTIHKVDEGVPGSNMPPMHPRCRSTISITNLTTSTVRKRISRLNGEIKYVPADMNYSDWEKIYIKKSMTLNEWENNSNNIKLSLKEKISNIDLKTCTKDDIINIGTEVCNRFNIIDNIGNKEKLKEIFSNFREMGGEVGKNQWAKGCNTITKQQLSEAFSYYPKDWAEYLIKNNKKLYTSITPDRGFFTKGAVTLSGRYYATKFENYKEDYISIHMTGQRKQTPYHELGHYVEFFNKDVLRISKEFIKSRTKNENYMKLADLFPGFGFGNKEIVKPDNFITPYIGKEYEEASEVLSMGLEALYEPSQILKKIEVINGKYQIIYAKIEDDIEFLYLIVGLILKA